MSNAITLPPLPKERPLGWDTGYTESDLRARDQEIVRCVLEAAAGEASSFASVTYNSWHIANAIRALEFTHHE
jgi:hypothetical protein